MTVATPIIEESGANTIFIEAAYNCWSGRDRNEKLDLVSIPIAAGKYDEAFNRGGRENWVTVATLIIIERFCTFTILGDGTTGAKETGKRKHLHHPRKHPHHLGVLSKV